MMKILPNFRGSFNSRATLIVFGVLLLGLLLGWTLRGLLLSPDNLTTARVFDDWRTECPARTIQDRSCETFTLITDANGAAAGRISLLRDKDNQIMFLLSVPLGVQLQQGVGMTFEGEQQLRTFQYSACVNAGCVVMEKLDDKLAESLRNGKKGRVVFMGMGQDNVTSVNFTLDGYRAARSAFDSGNAKHSSWFWRLWS